MCGHYSNRSSIYCKIPFDTRMKVQCSTSTGTRPLEANLVNAYGGADGSVGTFATGDPSKLTGHPDPLHEVSPFLD